MNIQMLLNYDPVLQKIVKSMVRGKSIVLTGLLIGSAGCDPDTESELLQCNKDQDMVAILSMQGTFDVSFFFQEKASLDPDYTPIEEPYTSQGVEVVDLIHQSEDQIILQHVLVIETAPGEYFPLKHWRQDWTFEDTQLFEYQGEQVWRHRSLQDEEVRCAWSQAVSQVDDGPRYEGVGRWQHSADSSTWVSNEVYRPLPRREAARQDEYDVLLAVNSHTILSDGWDHEQDNIKWRLDSSSGLVEELGYNFYARIDSPLTSVVEQYHSDTGAFWQDVRSVWALLLGESGAVRVLPTLDGVAPFEQLFALESQLQDTPSEERLPILQNVLSPYVIPLGM